MFKEISIHINRVSDATAELLELYFDEVGRLKSQKDRISAWRDFKKNPLISKMSRAVCRDCQDEVDKMFIDAMIKIASEH